MGYGQALRGWKLLLDHLKEGRPLVLASSMERVVNVLNMCNHNHIRPPPRLNLFPM